VPDDWQLVANSGRRRKLQLADIRPCIIPQSRQTPGLVIHALEHCQWN